MCRGSGLSAQIAFKRLPLIHEAVAHARNGIVTGASARNWSGYGSEVVLPADFADWQCNLLSDPQTSGGLLVSCTAVSTEEVLGLLRDDGFSEAAVIGHMEAGPSRLAVA